MSSQYDQISKSFGKVEGLSIRQHIEFFSVFRALGPLGGKSALDGGCGTGIYARQLKQHGAERVVGLDVSEAMIEVARAEELQSPAGIDYVVGDIAAAGALGPFDVATAGYLFGNASTTDELYAMSRGIYEALAPGGMFAATVLNDAFQSTDPAYYARYGIALRHNGDLRDGSRVTVVISVGGSEITIESYYWTRKAFESALAGAGFSEVRWLPSELSPAGLDAHGEDAFREYIAHPHGLVVVCAKGTG